MQIQSTDIELIQDVLAGKHASYAELVRRHQRLVFSLALRFVKKREDAEEVAQDCFVKAYRSLHSFKGNSKFSTWLYSIVYTTSITFLRRNKPEAFSLDDENVSAQLENQIGEFDVNGQRLNREVSLLNKLLDYFYPMMLPLLLCSLGEQSLEEIAVTLGMEANTVKVKLFRSRHRLREK